MLGRVLVEQLGQRLPNSTVLAESGAVSSEPDATIELNVQRLDINAAGDLVLQAQAGVVFRGGSPPALRGFRFAVPAPTPDVAGQVAAASVALGQLADGLAAMLVAAPASSLAARPALLR